MRSLWAGGHFRATLAGSHEAGRAMPSEMLRRPAEGAPPAREMRRAPQASEGGLQRHQRRLGLPRAPSIGRRVQEMIARTDLADTAPADVPRLMIRSWSRPGDAADDAKASPHGFTAHARRSPRAPGSPILQGHLAVEDFAISRRQTALYMRARLTYADMGGTAHIHARGAARLHFTRRRQE